MASLNHLLFWVNYIIVVGAAVSALLYLFPAYRRRQNRAFLYLAFAFLLFIFDAVADHTFALWHIPRSSSSPISCCGGSQRQRLSFCWPSASSA
jgi:hypothetical protein